MTEFRDCPVGQVWVLEPNGQKYCALKPSVSPLAKIFDRQAMLFGFLTPGMAALAGLCAGGLVFYALSKRSK